MTTREQIRELYERFVALMDERKRLNGERNDLVVGMPAKPLQVDDPSEVDNYESAIERYRSALDAIDDAVNENKIAYSALVSDATHVMVEGIWYRVGESALGLYRDGGKPHLTSQVWSDHMTRLS